MNGYAVSVEINEEERERLILEHLPQVKLIARRIHERLPESICLDDLVSTGVIGLISAIDHFDPGHLVKLKTYAEYKIRGLNVASLEYDSGDQGQDLLHYIPDDSAELPSTLLERSELERLLAQSIDGIPEIERTVLSLYYHEELTLREIAQVVHLHESRISQLKSQAILRLRGHMAGLWPASRGMVTA